MPQPKLSTHASLVQQLLAFSPAPLQSDCQPEQILETAIDVLEAGDFQTRWEVAKLLPQLVSAEVVEASSAIAALLDLLQDEEADEELSWFALRILGQLDHADVVPALVRSLKAAHTDELRSITAAALAHQGTQNSSAATDSQQRRTQAIAALSRLLDDPDWRLLAVRSLSQIRHSTTIPLLLQVVQDPDAAVRAAAIEALSSFHDARIPPVLIEMLSDRAAAVRQEAVIGLGLRPDLAEALPLVSYLRPLLWDLDMGVCRQAAIALGRLSTEAATQALVDVLCALPTPLPLQVEAVRALGWIGTAKALGSLQQRLRLDSAPSEIEAAVRQEIVAELGRVGAEALKPQAAHILLALLESPLGDGSPELKQAIALSLGQLQQVQTLDPLIALLSDPDSRVQLHAIAALKRLDAAAAHSRLCSLAAAPDLAPALQQGLAIALAEWNI